VAGHAICYVGKGRVSSAQLSSALRGRGLEWEEIEEKIITKRTNLPAIRVLVLSVLWYIFVLLVGGISSGVPSNIRVWGKEPLSSSADRVWHGRGVGGSRG
jgi:hypothetical protein